MSEIKVYLTADENDDYVELWKEVNGERYYGRYTFNDEGIWYYVSDPLGYCELDCQVADDITFICCDINGNEQCRYSNAEPNPLVKFETYVKRMWEKFGKEIQHNKENLEGNFWTMCWDGTTILSLNKWLLSFKDPELYGDVARDYDENWYGCWKTHEIKYEPIEGTEFTYLGNKYQFTKVTKRHDICGVEWVEFFCTDAPYTMSDWANDDRPWINTYMFMGDWFDNSIKGTMHDRQTAIKRVRNAIADIYKGETISVITTSYGYTYERLYTYSEAAEKLIGHNYNIKYIDSVIEKEMKSPSFEIVSDLTIETRYPGVARDHKYNYMGKRWTA